MQSINFFLSDLDYYIGFVANEKQAIIRLYGKATSTPRSKRVLITLSDFYPYVYIESANNAQDKIILDKITNNPLLNSWFRSFQEEKRYKYYRREESRLLKITGKRPWEVPKIRRALQKEGLTVLEADIPFIKRFLIDNNIRCLREVTITNLKAYQEQNDLISAQCSYTSIHQKTDSSKLTPIILAFDIEVDVVSETIQQLMRKKEKRITAISIVWGKNSIDSQKEVNILAQDSDEAEKALLQWFIDSLQRIKPDVVTGYNSDNFDLPYLLRRMTIVGIPQYMISPWSDRVQDPIEESVFTKSHRIKGITVVDLFPKTWRLHPESGKKGLDDIANLVLGTQYRKLSVDASKLGLLWRTGIKDQDWSLLHDYVLQDSVLTYQLFFALGVRDWFEAVAITGAPPAEGINATERQLGEFELLRRIHQNGLIIPSLPNDQELNSRKALRKDYPHQGGLVFDPQGSLYEGPVLIADFRSMYPSLIVSHNLGGETLTINALTLKDPSIVNEIFMKQPQSVLAEMLEFFLVQRIELKSQIQHYKENDPQNKNQSLIEELNRAQTAIKKIINSVYGGTNYVPGRFYSHILSDAITTIGRNYLRSFQKNINKFFQGAETLYGDTDSLFIHLKQDGLQGQLEQHFRTGNKENLLPVFTQAEALINNINATIQKPMELILEDIAYRIVFKPGRKKAYSYVSALTNELIIKGFEAIRSDWSEISKTAQRQVLNCLLRETGSKIEREKKAKQLTLKICRDILDSSLELLKPKVRILGALKDPTKYKSITPAVAAYRHYINKMNIQEEDAWQTFDKFPYVITPSSNPTDPLYKRAQHPDLVSEIDRWHYIKEILRAVKRFGVSLSIEEVDLNKILLPLEYYL